MRLWLFRIVVVSASVSLGTVSQAQLVQDELKAMAAQLAVTSPYRTSTDCPFLTDANTDVLLNLALQSAHTGNWNCYTNAIAAVEARRDNLSEVQGLNLRLAQATGLTVRQRFAEAIQQAAAINREATAKKRPHQKAQALLLLSYCGLYTRDLAGGYAWADTALQLSRNLGNRRLEGEALMQMGLCARRNFTTQANRNFGYYQSAAIAAAAVADTQTLYLSELYTALDHIELKQAPIAMPYLRRALALWPGIHTLRGRYIGYVGLAYALQQAGAPEATLPLYKQALVLTTQADLPYSRQNALTFISQTFQELRQYDSALHYAEQAALVRGVDSFYTNLWGLKAGILRDAGRYKEATDAYPKALDWEANDAFYRSRNQLARYETALKTQEKELQVAQEKRRSTRLQWVVATVGALLLLLALAYAVQRRTQRRLAAQKALIERQSAELEASLAQKEILLKEIHHRVNNNLTVVSSLLELQTHNTTDAAAKEALTESQTRIRSIALIHEQLYRRQNLGGVAFKPFATALTQQVSMVLKHSGQHVTAAVDSPEVLLDLDTVVPLGLLLNELLTNSYKHAFAPGGEGRIHICLQEIDRGHFELTYADNGEGLAAGLELSNTTSMGLRLIRRLANQLSGEAVYNRTEKAFRIRFKDSATRNEEA